MLCFFAGLSDPFCVVRVDNSKKFKTNVIYESLTPVWNESVSIAMPQGNDKLIIVSQGKKNTTDNKFALKLPHIVALLRGFDVL